jgi:penicillin-binding protein 2
MSLKYKLIKIFFIIIFVLININSANLQLIEGSNFYNQSINLIIQEKSIVPQRGSIYDRNGILLAEDIEVFDLYFENFVNTNEEINAELESLKLDIEKIDPSLINTLNISIESLKDSNKRITLFKSLSKDQLNKLEDIVKNNKNLHVTSRFERSYKFPLETSHIIGYVGLPDSADLNSGYSSLDWIGKYRIESQYEDYLKGIKGKYIQLEGSEIFQEGQKGSDIYLNINIDWQTKVYSLLEQYSDLYYSAGGAGVIMNSETGEVVTLVSYPGYDINSFIKGISEEDYKNLQDSRLQPLLDKAISSAATPGSIFKLVSASTLLESEIIDINDSYYSNRCIYLGPSRFCEFGQNFYGYLNVVQALVKSSNLFFCNYSLDLETTQGINSLVEMANSLGLGNVTGIDLEGEVGGQVDSPDYKMQVVNEAWYPGDTCNTAIGQGANLVTPIQMAALVASIESNGSIVKPRVLKEIIDSRKQVIFENNKQVKSILNLKKETIELVKEGMSGVAYDPGSATYALLNDVPGDLRVKTGSAETFENIEGSLVERTHSWIVGSFEYNGERYSFAFFLRYGGGGYYITPIVSDFVEYVYN